jgi:hypothetical protein
MDRVHKKSMLPETSPLLQAAHGAGTELLWDRYERQLPLCGFTSNGLNCRKCFQGPCRINPFGDEPVRGVCGADRDQIAMEHLFQVTLDGVLDSARTVALLGSEQKLPDLAEALGPEIGGRLSKAGLLPVRRSDLYDVQNGYFSHKGFLGQTLRDLTRLGLIQYGLLTQAAGAGTAGAAAAGAINLLILGQAPQEFVQATRQAADAAGQRINLIGQAAGLPPALDQGSPELALLMSADALVLCPNAAWPGAGLVAVERDIPVVLADGQASAKSAFEQAARHAQRGSYATATPLAAAPAPELLQREAELRQAVAAGRIAGFAVLLGETNAKHAFFERTLALMEAAAGARVLVLLGGELSAQAGPLCRELNQRKPGLLGAFASELGALAPVCPIGPCSELPKTIALLSQPGLRTLPAAYAFPEFYRASTWATAVSLFALGCAVQIGIRLPFWGSPALPEIIQKWQEITGGTLLTAPQLPGPDAQAEALLGLLKTQARH